MSDDWDYTLAGLSFINREKIDIIREAGKELERDEKGRLRGADYVIFEQPQPPLISDLPTLENPTQLNKDIQKIDLFKKEKSNTDLSSTDSIPIHSLNPLPYDGEADTPLERKRQTHTAFMRKSSRTISSTTILYASGR